MRSLTMTCRNVLAVVAGAWLAFPMTAQAATLSLTINPPLTGGGNVAAIHYGETLTWEAVIANLGPDLAQGTQITTFNLDPGLKLVGVTGCTAPEGQTDPIPCTIDSDPPGTIYQRVPDPENAGSFLNTKTVSFDVELPMPQVDGVDALPTTCPAGATFSAISIDIADAADDTVTASTDPVVIGNYADLGVEMTAPEHSTIGGEFDVEITVTNHGPCDAHDVSADDANPDFAQFLTSYGIQFLGSEGVCTDIDPTMDSCSFATLAPNDPQTWTLHYKVLNFPGGLMQASEIVALTVYSTADDAFDYNARNDTARTDTVVSKHRASCSTGGMGQALSLLALALPFLRRRRKV